MAQNLDLEPEIPTAPELSADELETLALKYKTDLKTVNNWVQVIPFTIWQGLCSEEAGLRQL